MVGEDVQQVVANRAGRRAVQGVNHVVAMVAQSSSIDGYAPPHLEQLVGVMAPMLEGRGQPEGHGITVSCGVKTDVGPDKTCPITGAMDSVPVKVTSPERARRDADIVRDRARGRSWASLARRHGLSDRHCRRIVAEHAHGHPQLEGLDPLDVVTGIYGRYEPAIDELVDLSDQARNESARVGAIKARIEIIKAETDLLQAIGVLPREYRATSSRTRHPDHGRRDSGSLRSLGAAT